MEIFQQKGHKSISFFITIIAFIEQRNLKSFKVFSSEFVLRLLKNPLSYQAKMVSTSGSSIKVKKGSEMLVKGVEWKAPNFKLMPTIVENLDLSGA